MPADKTRPATWSDFLGMGAVIAAQVVAGLLLGLLLDALIGTGPVFTLIGLTVGVVAAVAYTVSKLRELLVR